MEEQENKLREESRQIEAKLSDSSIYATSQGQQLGKRLSEVNEILAAFDTWRKIKTEYDQTLELSLADTELGELAKLELDELQAKAGQAKQKLDEYLVPKDPSDQKAAIIEIRGGAGGDEAALFAGELYRMYVRYAERNGWAVELISETPSSAGGFKEIIFNINARSAYGQLKFESGVHRVQRVPITESGGRTHTSTATVAVLPEAEEADIEINPSELRIDVFRSSGPGGQSVNTTDSAVRITHIPTGLIVTCQDEKSQHKNKAKALGVLRSRLLAAQLESEQAKRSQVRRSQIGSGDRSEKVRTYNFPQDRVTDHRIKVSLSNLPQVMDGKIDELIDQLHQADRQELN